MGGCLRNAVLSGAVLSGAVLSQCKQKVIRIQGSRHEINAIDSDVRIGCQRHPVAFWLKHFVSIGRAEGYTPQQIAEYGAYLRMIAELISPVVPL